MREMERRHKRIIKEFFKISLANLEFSALYLRKYSIILRTLGKVILIDPADTIDVDVIGDYSNIDYVFFSCRLNDHYNKRKALEIFRRFKPIFFADPSTYVDLSLEIPREYLISMQPGVYETADLRINAMLGLYEVPIIAYLIKVAGINILYVSRSEHIISGKEKVDVMILPLTGRYLGKYASIYEMIGSFRPKRIFIINWNEREISIFARNILDIAPYSKIIPLRPYTSHRVALEYP